MRRTRRISIPREDGSLVKVVYFSGRKGAPSDVCRNEQISSIRGKITLCSECIAIQLVMVEPSDPNRECLGQLADPFIWS